VVSSDGVVGLCYEHSQAEGIGILNIVDDFMSSLKKADESETEESPAESVNAEDIPNPIRLEWTIAPDTKNAVREASMEIDRQGENMRI